MNYKDFYISGRAVPDWDLSYFMKGYARNWYDQRKTRPPLAFTLIAVSDKVLVVRGSKTGGMAIFRRIEEDTACRIRNLVLQLKPRIRFYYNHVLNTVRLFMYVHLLSLLGALLLLICHSENCFGRSFPNGKAPGLVPAGD